MSIFSSPESLKKIENILTRYLRLPFSSETIPGAIMEAVLSNVRGGKVLNTYDFVDVVCTGEKCGWQIKSTKESTPVTWKRAKIPNALQLIKDSNQSADGLQRLGDTIIDFCNEHAAESMKLYGLDQIGYARLIVHKDETITYFEKLLCNISSPQIFNPSDFQWKWSKPKKTQAKEQLQALHGVHKATNKKWWAWHGLGENQLHFSGESIWWSTEQKPKHSFKFQKPSQADKLSLESFLQMLEMYDASS
jgi:hypothetical protein